MLTYNFANQVLKMITGKAEGQQSGYRHGIIEVGLSYTTPTRDGDGVTEPSGATGYERVLLGTWNQSLSQLMGEPDEGVIKNSKNIFFPKAKIDYTQNITHFLIFSGSTLIAYGELTNPIKPLQDTVPIVETDNLVMSIE